MGEKIINSRDKVWNLTGDQVHAREITIFPHNIMIEGLFGSVGNNKRPNCLVFFDEHEFQCIKFRCHTH